MGRNGGERSARLPRRILVVDDNAAIRNMVMDVIAERMDAECVLAESVPEAIELVEVHDFGAVVLDVYLDGCRGFDLYHHLKGRDDALARRILFVTGMLDTAEIDDLLRVSGNRILRKPFQINQLVSELRSILEEA